MKGPEFDQQMARLVSQFGKGAYSDERIKLLYSEVKDFHPHWFERVVDRFIGEFRQPPLMPEFREEIAKERDRIYQDQKRQHEHDADAFFSGIYQPEDTKTICQYILKRLRGGVDDHDYAKFVEHLKSTVRVTS